MKLPAGHTAAIGAPEKRQYSGFGRKMLEQMGWQGKGLGAAQQGREDRVTVKRREDALGVGATASQAYDWKAQWWEGAFDGVAARLAAHHGSGKKAKGSGSSSSSSSSSSSESSSSSSSSSSEDEDENAKLATAAAAVPHARARGREAALLKELRGADSRLASDRWGARPGKAARLAALEAAERAAHGQEEGSRAETRRKEKSDTRKRKKRGRDGGNNDSGGNHSSATAAADQKDKKAAKRAKLERKETKRREREAEARLVVERAAKRAEKKEKKAAAEREREKRVSPAPSPPPPPAPAPEPKAKARSPKPLARPTHGDGGLAAGGKARGWGNAPPPRPPPRRAAPAEPAPSTAPATARAAAVAALATSNTAGDNGHWGSLAHLVDALQGRKTMNGGKGKDEGTGDRSLCTSGRASAAVSGLAPLPKLLHDDDGRPPPTPMASDWWGRALGFVSGGWVGSAGRDVAARVSVAGAIGADGFSEALQTKVWEDAHKRQRRKGDASGLGGGREKPSDLGKDFAGSKRVFGDGDDRPGAGGDGDGDGDGDARAAKKAEGKESKRAKMKKGQEKGKGKDKGEKKRKT